MRGAAVVLLALLALAPGPSDLDAFMHDVLARRDDNWTKLRQYVLDETERVDIRGASETVVWGVRRDYTWFLRDGYFVRSPLRVDGVALNEAQRKAYEDAFLKRARQRDGDKGASDPIATDSPSATLQDFVKQRRDPQFISSAYFLKFKFEAGRYALVGRETLGNREVLRIEYYPERLFSDAPQTKAERRVRQAADGRTSGDASDEEMGDQIQRLMSKVSLVTLWVEPEQHQIVKFTLDNAGLDFLPMAWLARVSGLKATMTMSEAFPGVWLPRRIETTGIVTLASGRLDARYSLDYTNYREATVTTTIHGAER